MIDSSKYLPSLQLGPGSVVLEPSWLFLALRRAALAAGHPYWWPAEHVAKTVQFYFRSESSSEPIRFENFQNAVRRLLKETGHPDIAEQFLQEGLDLSVSFLEIVQRVPPGFELGFWREIEQTVATLLTIPTVGRALFQDLVPAIKSLLRRTHWCRECEQFRGEIVTYLRALLARRSPNPPFALCIR